MTREHTHTLIDVEQWDRKNHFHFYKNFPDPNFNICFNLDITRAYKFAKKHQLSPFLVLMYLSSQACNSVDAFKLRLDKQNTPYLISCVEPSATVANADGIFNFCNMEHHENLSEFIHINKNLVDTSLSEEPLANVKNSDYQVFYSITPWLNFTSYKHAKGVGFFDIPRIAFGKINSLGKKITMPISIELHHAIADAIDVARYENSFTEHMRNLTIA